MSNSNNDTLDDKLLSSIMKFYNNELNMKIFVDTVLEKKDNIPLRIYEWFVTNYSKKNDIFYTIKRPTGKMEKFFVYESYNIQLKTYKKKGFDPFFRYSLSKSYTLSYKNKDNIEIKFDTSIGQLYFFRWAIENLIIDYIKENIKAIETDMKSTRNLSKALKALENNNCVKKKTELSKSCYKTPIINYNGIKS